MSPDHPYGPDDLIARITELLSEPEHPDGFSWVDAMRWSPPEVTHDDATGRVFLDQAGYVF